jgi:hypothetical protein
VQIIVYLSKAYEVFKEIFLTSDKLLELIRLDLRRLAGEYPTLVWEWRLSIVPHPVFWTQVFLKPPERVRLGRAIGGPGSAALRRSVQRLGSIIDLSASTNLQNLTYTTLKIGPRQRRGGQLPHHHQKIMVN